MANTLNHTYTELNKAVVAALDNIQFKQAFEATMADYRLTLFKRANKSKVHYYISMELFKNNLIEKIKQLRDSTVEGRIAQVQEAAQDIPEPDYKAMLDTMLLCNLVKELGFRYFDRKYIRCNRYMASRSRRSRHRVEKIVHNT